MIGSGQTSGTHAKNLVVVAYHVPVQHFQFLFLKLPSNLYASPINFFTDIYRLSIDLRPCQHDNGYMDGRSQIKVNVILSSYVR